MTHRLHLVFGGELVSPDRTVFKDPSAIHVVGIFPDRHSLIHLVGAVLAEQHDELAESRRYLSLDVLSKSRAINDTPTEQKATPAALTA